MKTAQQSFHALPETRELAALGALKPQLLLAFAPPHFFQDEQLHTRLMAAFPQTLLVGASSGGNIGRAGLEDKALQLTAIHFDDPALAWASAESLNQDDSHATGVQLGEQLAPYQPQYVLLFAHRHNTSGHRLLQGLKKALPGVSISGCIASNPTDLARSFTLAPNGISDRRTVALGFCSPSIRISNGVSSGWRPFGPTRRVTRSQHNILYELDGESALSIYRRYLGHHLDDYAHARLLFSFEILDEQRQETGLIRAVQYLDDSNGSLILADDIVDGSYMRLMHASINALVGGSEAAVKQALETPLPSGEKLALIVSCIGRKIVMGQQIEDEIEAIVPLLNPDYQIAGLYSHGEFAPIGGRREECQILNETMAVTLISEAT